MTLQQNLKRTTIFTASALALAVASASHAVDFEVGDTTASVYGYAKLDFIYDVDADLGEFVSHGNIRLDGDDGSDGHTTMNARQSRIGFSTATPLEGSTLTTKIEGDFYGSGNKTFRLRHAYGSWNGILAGQTWTNFYGFVAGTPVIDFNSTFGTGNQSRQAQLRYTVNNFSISLEEPEALGKRVTFDGDAVSKSALPDLIARYTDTSGPFKYSASAMGRQLEVETDTFDDSTLGWGIALEGAMDLSEALTLRAGVTHGDGIGGYLNVSPIQPPAYIDGDGDIDTLEGTGGTVGASLKAGPGAINAAYSIATVDLDDETYGDDDTNETFESVHLNYIWSPAQRISYGIETSWHSREVADGRDGDAVRVQGMVMYSF
ncbi:hypothetical protein FHR95_002260 [Halomonas fontilapidosi]|uniref:Porin n=1 Tax=Halomonas fontilapidosi TaxID=616675 RepID=A0A7W5GZY1_9GAMM|nr:hypothetical protein [Halomonas fontilapidosi]